MFGTTCARIFSKKYVCRQNGLKPQLKRSEGVKAVRRGQDAELDVWFQTELEPVCGGTDGFKREDAKQAKVREEIRILAD